MNDRTSAPSAHPVRPGVPTEEETRRRMAFQATHPEVGFAPQSHCGEPWIAYWLAADGKPRHVTGVTLGDVLDSLAEEFGGTL